MANTREIIMQRGERKRKGGKEKNNNQDRFAGIATQKYRESRHTQEHGYHRRTL